MVVMREEYDLSALTHFACHSQRRFGTHIIKGLKNVVGNEWKRPVAVAEGCVARDPQREKELRPRTL